MTINILRKISFAAIMVLPFLQPFYSSAQMTTISVGGANRSMLVYAPTGLAQNRPLLISMHGLNQDIAYQKQQTNWEQVADTGKFVVVYPQGESNSWDISGQKDINFILAIIESMVTRYNIDRTRVYLSGFSMGGMMTYHAASNIADKIAAFAPVSSMLFNSIHNNSRPIPFIHTHGDADDVFPYDQKLLDYFAGWRTKLNCATTPVVVNSNGYKTSTWSPCDCNTKYVLVTLAGKGHWPSNDAKYNSSVGIWRFVKNYTNSKSCVTGAPVVNLTAPASNSTFTSPATINITATASDPNGTISKVEFYNGTTKLGEDATSPYAYSWTNVAKGTYSITAVATDNSGNKTTSEAIAIKVNVPQGPFNGIVHPIPGTIQAEEYDLGGNGIAYMDDSPGSEVTPVVNYRTDEDVDIETCTDAGGGYNLGFATAGEWLEYTVNVAATGNYKLDLRVACNGDGRTLSLTMDGNSIANNIVIPNTAGWQTWTTTTVNNVPLTAGQHVLRMTVGTTSYINLNFMTFSSVITGLDDASTSGVATVFPNPFKENFIIDVQGEFSYKLSNISGVIVAEGTGQGKTELAGQYSKGVYMLKLTQSNKTVVIKMIKD
jgi:poly(3-hydroxybutyrate) depolymerase